MNLLRKPEIGRYISTIQIKIQPSFPLRKQIYQNQSWNLKLQIDLRCVLWLPIWDISPTQSYKKSQILQRYLVDKNPKNYISLFFVWKVLLFCNFVLSNEPKNVDEMKMMMKIMCSGSFCVCVGNTGQKKILWQSPHQKSSKANYINFIIQEHLYFHLKTCQITCAHWIAFLAFFTQLATPMGGWFKNTNLFARSESMLFVRRCDCEMLCKWRKQRET